MSGGKSYNMEILAACFLDISLFLAQTGQVSGGNGDSEEQEGEKEFS